MEFGLSIPNRGPMVAPDAIGALAAKAEESGFVRLAVPDHIVIPKSYPPSAQIRAIRSTRPRASLPAPRVGLSTQDVVTLSTIARWFERRRGMMTGVVKVGTATGQMVLPPLTALLMVGLGWRNTVLTLGIAAAVLLLIAALSMKRPPERRMPGRSTEVRGSGFAEIRRSRAFRTLCAAQFLFFPSLITVPLHIARCTAWISA